MCRVPTLFQQWLSMTFPRHFHDQKMKIHDVSAQHIFPDKLYTIYECISELVVTAAAARSTIVKKLKPLVYLHIFTNISQQSVQHNFINCSWAEFLSAVVKIPWHYHHFLGLSMTFQDQWAPCTLVKTAMFQHDVCSRWW